MWLFNFYQIIRRFAYFVSMFYNSNTQNFTIEPILARFHYDYAQSYRSIKLY